MVIPSLSLDPNFAAMISYNQRLVQNGPLKEIEKRYFGTNGTVMPLVRPMVRVLGGKVISPYSTIDEKSSHILNREKRRCRASPVTD